MRLTNVNRSSSRALVQKFWGGKQRIGEFRKGYTRLLKGWMLLQICGRR